MARKKHKMTRSQLLAALVNEQAIDAASDRVVLPRVIRPKMTVQDHVKWQERKRQFKGYI